MTQQQVQAVLNRYYSHYKDTWEQTRFIAYVSAKVAGAGFKQPSDLMKFTWDTEEAAPVINKQELADTRAYFMEMMKDKSDFKPITSVNELNADKSI